MHPERCLKLKTSAQTIKKVTQALYREAEERFMAKQVERREQGAWSYLETILSDEDADEFFDEQSRLYRQVWLEMGGEVQQIAQAWVLSDLEAERRVIESHNKFQHLFRIFKEIWLRDGVGWPPPDPTIISEDL